MNESQKKLIELLASKSVSKYSAYDHALEGFNMIKEILKEIEVSIKAELVKLKLDIPIEYNEKGKYEVEFKIAGDVILFMMHTNIFEFPRAHAVMQTGYVKQDPTLSFCGTISVYNFLADSFKYNRINDVGYLVARIFINREGHYMVEGKRQLGFLFNNFANQKIDKESLSQITNAAINYAIEFDLLVPPFEDVKIISVNEMNQISSSVSLKTGKRLGFNYEKANFEIK